MLRIVEDAITFDDVLLLPSYSNILPAQVSLRTQLTENIHINIPVVSAAMDTVTESRLAISIAQEGGIGIIHKNMSISQQANEVGKVKKFENGMVVNPVTVSSDISIRDLLSIVNQYHFSSVPVLKNNFLVGLVTARDIRFSANLDSPIVNIMTPRSKLITVTQKAKKKDIQNLMHTHRIEKVLVVDDKNRLIGLITAKDIQKSDNKFNNSSKDSLGRLLVGAAVGIAENTEDRVRAVVAAGVDVIVVDTAHAQSQKVLNCISWIKNKFPTIQIIGGNVATAEAAKALVNVGVNAIKVGIGPGSICTTRVVAGVGVPQLTAISNVSDAVVSSNIPIIADGGIRHSGDICKAIAAGASSVMIGGLLAGTKESPGEVEKFQGRFYKLYRGMGSLGSMEKGSSDRYFQHTVAAKKLVPEGVEGKVPCKGPLSSVIHQLMGGLRSGMGYTGCKCISEMKKTPNFIKISDAGFNESHVHNIIITKEPPNYQAK